MRYMNKPNKKETKSWSDWLERIKSKAKYKIVKSPKDFANGVESKHAEKEEEKGPCI